MRALLHWYAGAMSDIRFRGEIMTVKVLDGHWEVVEHAPAVAVLVERDGRVLGVRQRRPAIRAETWELPAGLIDPGEEPHEAAARELAEETGLAGDLQLVTQFYSSPGFTDERVYLFRARSIRPAHADPDPGEDLTVEWRDPRDVWRSAARGELATSAFTLLGLAHLLGEADGA